MRLPTIGELSRRVTLLLRRDIPNTNSGVENLYLPIAVLWAKIEPVGSAIYQGGIQVGNQITHRITIRHAPDIDCNHVFDWNGQRFAVKRSIDINGEGLFSAFDVEEIELSSSSLSSWE